MVFVYILVIHKNLSDISIAFSYIFTGPHRLSINRNKKKLQNGQNELTIKWQALQ